MHKEVKDHELLHILKKRFGYEGFREGQSEILHSILEGKDTVVIKSTGAGKSLCYQLPSLLLEGITIVISPLISLMEDQVREARKMGRRDAISLHSGLNQSQRAKIIKQLSNYTLLYLSPEGIQNEQVMMALKKRGVSLFVIDEAHCISQWGHDFRLDYLKLASIRKRLGQPICLAMTATATLEVKKDIIHFANLENPKVFVYSVDRPNIYIKVERVDTEKEKKEKLLTMLCQRKDAGMIYFSSRAKAEEMTYYLLENGITNVSYYHGGMSSDERNMIQQQFLNGELQLICATNAFGMGINKPNIRFVVHYHYPSYIESYVQEMGRCSRDGAKGLSYVFAQEEDKLIPYRFLDQECLDEQTIKELVNYLNFKYEHQQKVKIEETSHNIQCPPQGLQVVFFHLLNMGVCYKEGRETITISQEEYQVARSITAEVTDQLVKTIQRQRSRKLKKITDMNQWLKLSDAECRRMYLLHYFSDTRDFSGTTPSSTQPTPCCDLCDLGSQWYEQDIDQLNNVSILAREKKDKEFSWKEKLDRLWP
jgi:ATP-dependent DNA helicase RecQ